MKKPDIIDGVLKHRQPVQAVAESETLIFFRVKIAGAQNIGVHQAAAQNFQPAGIFA